MLFRSQEILLLYPGYFQPRQQPNLTFEPLLQTGKVSGVSSFFDLVQPSPSGFTINPNPSRTPDGRTYVMAASVRSDKPIVEDPGAHPLNLVLISDIDFLSDSFFSIRATAGPLARFDNIRFFENTVDLLAGDTSFIALRDRQPEYRTLERLESRTRSYMEARTGEEQQAQQEAAKALEAARARLTSRVEAVNQRTDLDAVGKQIMVRNLRDIETRQLRVLETNIARARDARVRASREEMEAQVRRTRAGVRTAAVLLPPLPVFAFGLVVLARRRRLARTSARLAGRERTQA